MSVIDQIDQQGAKSLQYLMTISKQKTLGPTLVYNLWEVSLLSTLYQYLRTCMLDSGEFTVRHDLLLILITFHIRN
mgnify:CR=1 FL=1